MDYVILLTLTHERMHKAYSVSPDTFCFYYFCFILLFYFTFLFYFCFIFLITFCFYFFLKYVEACLQIFVPGYFVPYAHNLKYICVSSHTLLCLSLFNCMCCGLPRLPTHHSDSLDSDCATYRLSLYTATWICIPLYDQYFLFYSVQHVGKYLNSSEYWSCFSFLLRWKIKSIH